MCGQSVGIDWVIDRKMRVEASCVSFLQKCKRKSISTIHGQRETHCQTVKVQKIRAKKCNSSNLFPSRWWMASMICLKFSKQWEVEKKLSFQNQKVLLINPISVVFHATCIFVRCLLIFLAPVCTKSEIEVKSLNPY